MESRSFSRGWWIAIAILKVTTIIFLLISLIILVTNVLRVPYNEYKVETIHFHDVSGFKYMLSVIIIVIGYSTLQIFFFALRHMKENHDPNFLCLYYGEWASSILLVLGAISGFSTTREYKKWLRGWLGDEASENDNYFLKSYGSASLLLLAFLCTFTSSIIFSCACSKSFSHLLITKNPSKVNPVVDDP